MLHCVVLALVCVSAGLCAVVSPSRLSSQEKIDILNRHNYVRLSLSLSLSLRRRGEPLPMTAQCVYGTTPLALDSTEIEHGMGLRHWRLVD